MAFQATGQAAAPLRLFRPGVGSLRDHRPVLGGAGLAHRGHDLAFLGQGRDAGT
jgi:hypothetical protein